MSTALQPEEVCSRLAAWAEAANVMTAGAGTGRLAIWKSDLLNRLMYGGEKGPSQTPCPVHKGKWAGCYFGWPGSQSATLVDGRAVYSTVTVDDLEPHVRAWWDAGCRCSMHKGSGCATGWQPDDACGCGPYQEASR